MKKGRIFGMALLAAAAFILIAALHPAFGASNNLGALTWQMNVTLLNQQPDPAEPGQIAELRFKIENAGTENAEDVVIEILPKYPFSIEPGENALRYIGSVHGKQLGKTGVIVKYRLKVDESAAEGEDEIELRYMMNYGQSRAWTKPDPFKVSIQSHDAIIAVESIDIAPETLSPGEKGLLSIELKNMAASLLKDITLKLDVRRVERTSTTVTTTEYPFSPVGSSNEKTIEKIAPGESAKVQFRIVADPDAKSKSYRVPLRIDYSDELGKNYTDDVIVGIIVGEEPDLAVNLEETNIVSSGMKGTSTIKLVNKGTNDVKFCYVTLGESEEYKILGPLSVYVGKIDSDDYETVDYSLYVESKNDKVILPITVEYKDNNNKDYEKNIEIPLNLYSGREAKKYGLKSGSSGVGIFIVIIIVGAGLFFYLRWRKRRRARK